MTQILLLMHVLKHCGVLLVKYHNSECLCTIFASNSGVAAELWSAANHVARDASNPYWWLPAVGMALLALAVYLLQSLAVCALLGWRGGFALHL